MKFLSANLGDFEQVTRDSLSYQNYLLQKKDLLPEQAFLFASSSWHLDFSSHKCPHDGWIKTLEVIEIEEKQTQQGRRKVRIELLCAYHDWVLRCDYLGVQELKLSPIIYDSEPREWIIDEIIVADDGAMIHEIALSNDEKIVIKCKDFSFSHLAI